MDKTVHLSIDIRGVLRWPVDDLAGMFFEGQKLLTPWEAQQYLIDQLALGRKFLPTANPICDGFSYETGCPGHDEVKG